MNLGQWWRAVLAAAALAAASLIIYLLFSSGFGRTQRVMTAVPPPVPQPELVLATTPAPAPTAVIAVVSDNFWLTYLPAGLERTGGGAVRPEPGVEGGWARFGTGDRAVEAQVEHGTVAADWETYRKRATLTNPRAITVRGKPAMIGGHPGGGRVIVWLERVGTGAWIRVSDSLSADLLTIAASVRAPVGD
ncbi:hypothetical protein OIE66_36300 [Nonomuraea sp. NBC_01738]|uniref:hypothetical protein n=1 Tax=Nonomuraea sp. NBC_01738 TaxID=2976003 RepID=UPI002E15374B|nr:hypothetical protein OIE66_36300 [Nonomuraea sp. NBC_01738]